jgi:hypothetical protein
MAINLAKETLSIVKEIPALFLKLDALDIKMNLILDRLNNTNDNTTGSDCNSFKNNYIDLSEAINILNDASFNKKIESIVENDADLEKFR